jgi:hypothetical protein
LRQEAFREEVIAVSHRRSRVLEVVDVISGKIGVAVPANAIMQRPGRFKCGSNEHLEKPLMIGCVVIHFVQLHGEDRNGSVTGFV